LHLFSIAKIRASQKSSELFTHPAEAQSVFERAGVRTACPVTDIQPDDAAVRITFNTFLGAQILVSIQFSILQISSAASQPESRLRRIVKTSNDNDQLNLCLNKHLI
jgi:hypothetical protein